LAHVPAPPAAAIDLWDAIASEEFNPCSWPFVECDKNCQPGATNNTITGL
jgi:hypothetical protein